MLYDESKCNFRISCLKGETILKIGLQAECVWRRTNKIQAIAKSKLLYILSFGLLSIYVKLIQFRLDFCILFAERRIVDVDESYSIITLIDVYLQMVLDYMRATRYLLTVNY